MLYIVVVVAYVPGYVPISIQCSQDWSIASFENRTLLCVVTMVMTFIDIHLLHSSRGGIRDIQCHADIICNVIPRL